MFSDVQLIAYQKWEEAGQPDGRDVEFWLAAEAEWHDLVAPLAYDLWELHGKPEGKDLHFWLEAEQIVRIVKKMESRFVRLRRCAILDHAAELAKKALYKEEDERIFSYLTEYAKESKRPWWQKLLNKVKKWLKKDDNQDGDGSADNKAVQVQVA